MIFKGGTSLSKAYRVIERLSEDIDVSLDRHALGFDADSWKAAGSKESKRMRVDLKERCRIHVHDMLRESLVGDIQQVLGVSGLKAGWSLTLGDDNAPDLVFSYPATELTPKASQYLAPNVLLEFGPFGDHWPAVNREITPFAAEVFADEFAVGSSMVQTLDITRTFWEKATILHSLASGGPSKVRGRMARHYYDLVKLADAPEAKSAVDRMDLLEVVAQHKDQFFPAKWASYETAMRGTLRLVPPRDVADVLEKDYAQMAPLFREDPPTFSELLERLAALELHVNQPLS